MLKRCCIFFVLCALVVAATVLPSPGEQCVAEQKLEQLVNPEVNNNPQFTQYLRDRLKEIFAFKAKGQLTITVSPQNLEGHPGDKPNTVYMIPSFSFGRPVITVGGPMAYVQYSKLANGRAPINSFAAGLVHEYAHLLQGEAFFRTATKQTGWDEERRVWRLVNEQVVRPMRLKGELFQQAYELVDEALRSCNDSSPCPAFERQLKELMPAYAGMK
jgi:hypothetical protein